MATLPHPILSNLGVSIRRLRRQRGLSQEALADLAQIDRSYMSGIERGRRNVSVLNAARIAAALRVPMAELLLAEEPPAETFRDVTVAVDELAEALRILQPPVPAQAAKPQDDGSESWKPGWYISLS